MVSSSHASVNRIVLGVLYGLISLKNTLLPKEIKKRTHEPSLLEFVV